MTCPYSMSRPGGVQGQILGLSRELRRRGVDVRVLAPCDGPPPDPGIVSVGPTVEWDSNGSVAPIAPSRAQMILIISLGALSFWSLIAVLVANVRDHTI